MDDFYNINKSNIFHIINNNNISCTRKYINKLSKLNDLNDLNDLNNKRLCKNCFILFIVKYKINNIIFHKYKNHIYHNLLINIKDNDSDNIIDNTILKKKYIGKIDSQGNIYINDYYINIISINKKKYYLLNDKDLYTIDNLDIFNINSNLKIGKLLGPKMCIINKKMITSI